jgi:WD40 repeat protein
MAGFTLTEALPLMQGLASKVANPQDYLAEAVEWTGGQPFLIQRLLGIIGQELAGVAPPQNVALWVENLVQERIVTNWESQDAPPHLTTIRDRVLSVEEKLRGRMLGFYQQVLADGELEDDRSEERSKLRLTGLVVRRDGRLVSYNPIYGAVFNNSWVEGQLADLRPEFYASAFRAWQDAEDGQNQVFLLRGKALEEAEIWSRGKRLSDMDEQFLRESRKFEKQEIFLRLEAERQGREAAELSKRVEEQKREAAELAKEIQAKATESEQKLKQIYSLVVKSVLSLSDKPLQSLLLAIIAADLNLSQFPNNIIDEVRLVLYQVIHIAKERNVLLSDHGIQAIAISPDSKIVAYACKNGVLRISDRNGNLIREFDKISSDIFSIAFSPDSLLIAVGSRTNIRLYDLAGNPNSNPFSIKSGINFQKIHLFFLCTIADPLVSTGKILGVFLLGLFFCSFLVLFFSEFLRMTFLASQTLSLSIVSISMIFILLLALNKFGEHGTFTSLAFSPNGKYIVSGNSDNQLQLWNLTGKLVQSPFQGHTKRIMSVAFSPDSKYIVSGSQDSTTKLWSFRGRLILDRYSLPTTSYVTSVAFSPNGKLIVSGNTDKNVILQDRKGDLPQIFRGHENAVTSVAFSPDGKYIVSGSYDKTVRLWNIEGSPPQIFKGHEDVVTSVAFSPDGKYIVSGSSDKTVRFWDTQDNFSKDLLDCLYAACNILKDHPAIKNPQSIEASQASEICQKYNSGNQNNPEPLEI